MGGRRHSPRVRAATSTIIHIPDITRILCCAWTPLQSIRGKMEFEVEKLQL
ncbi:Hypothetical protein SMAX5B_012024 [Scophthalmus maximus]|uniref:Uncharacterized protein n=1 Tax=Scophthalmus maximus TaxID=52904 RepID=A0A2U9AYT2_SCOMX|nr:Hypothetical protein SMAX5B_012024 [Scophthalmus maximus]